MYTLPIFEFLPVVSALPQDVVKVGVASNDFFLSLTKLDPDPSSTSLVTLQLSQTQANGNWTGIASFPVVNNTAGSAFDVQASFNTR